ncbi:MAG: acyl carrier protein [Pseudomonadales bacterium]
MIQQEILEDFTDILRGILFDDGIELGMETTRDEVDGWDSFNYVNFIVAVEMKYDVKFKVSDVESFQTVGDIIRETARLAK